MDRISQQTVALTYPGRGVVDPGLLTALGRQSPDVKRLLDRVRSTWTDATGDDLRHVECEERRPDDVDSGRRDLAVFAAGVAMHHALAPGLTDEVVHVGHGLGEIAALTSASAWSVEDGTRIVAARSAALSAVRPGGGTMAVEADLAHVAHLLEMLGDTRLSVAAQNGPGHTVVAGPLTALHRVRTAARAVYLRTDTVVPQPALHSPLVASATDALEAAVRRIGWRDPVDPVYSPISGRFYRHDDDLATELARHLVTPVDFGSAVTALRGAGVALFVECGAHCALTAAVQRTLRALGGPADWRAVAGDGGAFAPPLMQAENALVRRLPAA